MRTRIVYWRIHESVRKIIALIPLEEKSDLNFKNIATEFDTPPPLFCILEIGDPKIFGLGQLTWAVIRD